MDRFYGRAHQHEMLHIRVVGHGLQHELLEPAGVEVSQALVDADGANARIGDHLVALHVSEVAGLRNPADNGRVWGRRAPKVKAKASSHAGDREEVGEGRRGTDGVDYG